VQEERIADRLDHRDLFGTDAVDAGDAGARRRAIDMYRTGAA